MRSLDFQAAALQRLRDRIRRDQPADEPKKHVTPGPDLTDRLLVISSGKGGVGKTNLAVNLAVALQQAGHHTLVIDADIGLGNVETLCGLHCAHNLGDFFNGAVEFTDIVEVGPAGIWCAAGGTVLGDVHSFDESGLRRLLAGLLSLKRRPSRIILDLPAGLNDQVRASLAAASEVILVTTPEPTALADAYAVVKATAPLNPTVHMRVVVNQAHSAKEGKEAFERLRWAAARYLGLHISHAATVPADPAVPRAVRRQEPFMLSSPLAPASRAVRALAQQLDHGAMRQPQGNRFTRFLYRLVNQSLANGDIGSSR